MPRAAGRGGTGSTCDVTPTPDGGGFLAKAGLRSFGEAAAKGSLWLAVTGDSYRLGRGHSDVVVWRR